MRMASALSTDEHFGNDRERNLNKLRTWVGGLERIGDAEQVVALLVQSEVSLVNLKWFTVDELAASGVGEAVACELLSQLSSLEQSSMMSPRSVPISAHRLVFRLRMTHSPMCAVAHRVARARSHSHL
jgi:hypothetical protein